MADNSVADKAKKKKKDKKKKTGDKEEANDEQLDKNNGILEGDRVEEVEDDGLGEVNNDGVDEEKAKKKKAKKDKKEKKDTKDEKEKKKKKTGIAALIEERKRLIAQQEEEERRQKEEEEKREEEARRKKEETERMEKEKKEREEQQRLEEIRRQQKEGTYQTKKQKQESEKARRMLEAQGLLPRIIKDESGPKKKPYYGKKKPQKMQDKKPTDEGQSISEQQQQDDQLEGKTSQSEVAKEEEVLESWEEILESPESTMAAQENEISKISEGSQQQKSTGAVAEELSESESEASSSDEDESEGSEEAETESISTVRESREELIEKVRNRLQKRRELAEANRTTENLRAAIICVLGHVDTGKTKLLDRIRKTDVQGGEAGGITQQMGATRVPIQALKQRYRNTFPSDDMKLPGFLIIDTPGHESFSNMRSRGTSLCDIAILVVDIMHGLEAQTIESLNLLLKRKTPFVVALNKIDRLYGYESNPSKDIWQHLKAQTTNVQLEFKERFDKIVAEFAEQGLNIALSHKNPDLSDYLSVVPISALQGDGIGNLMAHIAEQCQTTHVNKLTFSDELDCIVMEVRSLTGLGTTIDVILINGTLRINDIIVLTGNDGPIATIVRDLLMPQPLKEIRVKNEYEHHKEIKGAQGVKILAKGLEKTVAGLPLFVANREDELEVLKDDAENQLKNALMAIKKKSEGVYVQASTLGSLEALLEFLRKQKIPYSNVNIGPVHKRDVQKAAAMLEHNTEYACILAFDVPVDREVQQLADREGVRIFQANIIYHLEDSFLNYRKELALKRRQENEHLAVFPCRLRVMPQHVFNARNPIVCGVSVEAGQLRKGTPIVAKTKSEIILLGTVATIERNHEQMDIAKQGDEVCVKIENTTGDAPKLYGRHFTHEDPLISKITRESIDVCKNYFRDDLSKADWSLIVQLKKWLQIL